jgi:ABC-2 type transport system permease protein
MNWELIGGLVRLRYKLMWAKTRSRNGKIALFVTGYLLLTLVAALLALGGLGAGVAAIQSAKAEQVAQAVLSGLFVNAVFGTVLMGFGMNAAFSDVELRRYPLRERERFLARHFLGILDPFWFLILALEAGLVVGLYIYGTYSFWYGAIAVLLLFVCGYLVTRVVGVWIDRLMSTRSGSAVVLLLVLSLSMVPGTLAGVLKANHGLIAGILGVLRYTPPFGAAAAMTHEPVGALLGLGVVAVWSIALVAALVLLERRPTARQQVARVSGSIWNSPCDRVGALFGRRMAPLVGYWLRFYLRNNRFRMLYLLSLPLAAFLTFNLGQMHRIGGGRFLAALGTLGIATFLGTSRIAVNQYGYVGGAFRRFFLFPTDPAASLRAGSYAAVLLGAAMLPPAAVLWAVFAPRPLDVRVVLMPAIDGVTALFAFHGLGLWVSLYGPRRGNYDKSLGNDMSLMGNVVVIVAMLVCMFLPMTLSAVAPAAVSPRNWWFTLPPAALAVAFYLASLRGASARFPARREWLLAVVEGKA